VVDFDPDDTGTNVVPACTFTLSPAGTSRLTGALLQKIHCTTCNKTVHPGSADTQWNMAHHRKDVERKLLRLLPRTL
jgi:hypothetical protein